MSLQYPSKSPKQRATSTYPPRPNPNHARKIASSPRRGRSSARMVRGTFDGRSPLPSSVAYNPVSTREIDCVERKIARCFDTKEGMKEDWSYRQTARTIKHWRHQPRVEVIRQRPGGHERQPDASRVIRARDDAFRLHALDPQRDFCASYRKKGESSETLW
jgi:hypothetical protein